MYESTKNDVQQHWSNCVSYILHFTRSQVFLFLYVFIVVVVLFLQCIYF